MGRFIINEEFRVKFAKNEKSIVSIADGWTLGTVLNSKKELKRLFSISSLLSAVCAATGNISLFSSTSTYIRHVYLPKPIFRYYSLDPDLLLHKLNERRKIVSGDWHRMDPSSPRISGLISEYRMTGNKDAFWKSFSDYILELQSQGYFVPKEVRKARYLPDEEHPEIIRRKL